MTAKPKPEVAPDDLPLWRHLRMTKYLVRSDRPDLSMRQMSVLLTVYLEDGPHTVRGLAADLDVSKPAITRALDRLGELDLVRRKVDPMDRRSVLILQTPKGAALLREMRNIPET